MDKKGESRSAFYFRTKIVIVVQTLFIGEKLAKSFRRFFSEKKGLKSVRYFLWVKSCESRSNAFYGIYVLRVRRSVRKRPDVFLWWKHAKAGQTLFFGQKTLIIARRFSSDNSCEKSSTFAYTLTHENKNNTCQSRKSTKIFRITMFSLKGVSFLEYFLMLKFSYLSNK